MANIQNFITDFKEAENIDLKKILEIRTYIPIAEKRAIFETILDECFTAEDGVLTCNCVLKKMMFESAMVKYHTNLDLDITSEEDYDALRVLQKTVVDFSDEYEKDYKECRLMLKEMERELRARYAIESSIARLSYQISGSIDKLVSGVADKIGDFDMSKFGFDSLELDQFKDLLNKYGK